MLTLRDALESALVEDPDDVATHYVYADYLQEQGDPRGEFIQLQLALEDPQRTEGERRRLQARVEELLQEHQREWLGIFADDLFPDDHESFWTWLRPFQPPLEHQFARGWLDSLALRDRADCVRRTDLGQMLCLAPEARLMRKLLLEYDDGLIEDMLPSPYLLNLRAFQLGKPLGDFSDPFQIIESPPLAELIGKLPRIEELRLFARGYDVAHLFALGNLSSLRILQIYYAGLYPLEVLANNPVLSNLTRLLLHPHSFAGPLNDLAAARAIVQSPHLRSLTHLQLHRSDLGDVGCTEIVTSGILKRLKVLDLRCGEITDTGARILADCPDLRGLELLDIERNALTQSGIDALRRVLGPALRGDNQQTAEEVAQQHYLYEDDFV
ncbi:MAG: TIGR02996 domain-containing protein [Gemmataceae bacterium]